MGCGAVGRIKAAEQRAVGVDAPVAEIGPPAPHLFAVGEVQVDENLCLLGL